MHNFVTNKASGYERESAAMAFQSFAALLGPPVAPILLPSLPPLFGLYMNKGEAVRKPAAAEKKSDPENIPSRVLPVGLQDP